MGSQKLKSRLSANSSLTEAALTYLLRKRGPLDRRRSRGFAIGTDEEPKS